MQENLSGGMLMFVSLSRTWVGLLPGSKFRRLVPVLVILSLGISITGAAAGGFRPPQPVPDDRRDVPQPVKWDANEVADGFKAQFVYPIKRFLKISRHLRALAGKPKEAMNVNAFDEVDDCSWFVNRNALRRMTLKEIARGLALKKVRKSLDQLISQETPPLSWEMGFRYEGHNTVDFRIVS